MNNPAVWDKFQAGDFCAAEHVLACPLAFMASAI